MSYDLDNVVNLKLNVNSPVMVPVVSRVPTRFYHSGVYTNQSQLHG